MKITYDFAQKQLSEDNVSKYLQSVYADLTSGKPVEVVTSGGKKLFINPGNIAFVSYDNYDEIKVYFNTDAHVLIYYTVDENEEFIIDFAIIDNKGE